MNQGMHLKQKLEICLAIKGITFRELATMVGLSHEGLYAIIRCRRIPRKKSVVKYLIDLTQDLDEKYKICIEDFIQYK